MDEDGDGFTVAEGDCDDHDVWVNPAWPEKPNDNKDNNCNGLVDEAFDGVTLIESGASPSKLLDVDLYGDATHTATIAAPMSPGSSGTSPLPVQIGDPLTGAGWIVTDGPRAQVGALDDNGAYTVLWDDSATVYDAGTEPVGYFGNAKHPDGYYVVSGGDRLWRVDPDGTATVLAAWDCLEGDLQLTSICPVDVAVNRFSGEVSLFGYFGGYATWSDGVGLRVIVPDDTQNPPYTFIAAGMLDDGTPLALGTDNATGERGIYAWNDGTGDFDVYFDWVDTFFEPVDFAIDQITGDLYVSANGGWFATVWRLTPSATNPYMAMLYPASVDPRDAGYVDPTEDRDAQAIAVRYTHD